MEVQPGMNVVESPTSGLTYVTSEKNTEAVKGAIEAAQPQELQVLRDRIAELEAGHKSFRERAKERGEANREKRKNGFGEFWKKVKGAFDSASATAEGMVDIGVENAKDPIWRAEQKSKLDNAIAGVRERSSAKSKEIGQSFTEGFNKACDIAESGIRSVVVETGKIAAEAGKGAINAFGTEVMAPLLYDVVTPVIEVIDSVDGLIADVRAGAVDLVGKPVLEKAGRAYDWINGNEHLNELATLAEGYRQRETDKKGLGKLIVDIDNTVELVRGQFEKLFGWGKKMKKEAASIRSDFKGRHEANSDAMDIIDNEAIRIQKQGLI